MVSNIPSAGTGNAIACAEHAILLTLSLLRNLPGCQHSIQERRLGEPCGETLYGKEVLVLGFGGIARELIPRLTAFGATTSCVRATSWSHADAVCLHTFRVTMPWCLVPDLFLRAPWYRCVWTWGLRWQHACGCAHAQEHITFIQMLSTASSQHPMTGVVQAAGPAQHLTRRGLPGDLPGLLKTVDVVIVTASQDASNRGMVNADFLSHCKCAACLRYKNLKSCMHLL
jgi:D-isomer specific 2-hydroxyacid dehydrogenase, NAD binding domain